MQSLIVTFLGTGNAIPTKQRNHTAIFVKTEKEGILIDCGEGTQRQFKQAGISLHDISSLLITHWHGDHILGIPGLLQTLAMSEYKKTLNIYGPPGTKRFIDSLENILGKVHISLHVEEISKGSVKKSGCVIESSPAKHGAPANAYSIITPDRVRLHKKKIKKYKLPNSPLLGQLQAGKDIVWKGKKIRARELTYTEKGKKITCVLDTAMNENAIILAKEADLLICESTFSKNEAEKAKEYFHLTAADAATIAKKAKAKSLILTHISQRYEANLKELDKEAKKIFKNTKIAEDLDVVTI